MTVRDILTTDSNLPFLRKRAPRVTQFKPWLSALAADMAETMIAYGGVGLAAPQVGQSLRLIVVRLNKQIIAFVNPEILKADGATLYDTEGCLSMPGYLGVDVPRFEHVHIRMKNLKGVTTQFHANGYFARVLQHEIDHLDGKLYIDHISPDKVRNAKMLQRELGDAPMNELTRI